MADTEYTRADWLRDLRSGEFKQGKHSLKEGECYCCVGVAAKGLGVEESLLDNDSSLGYTRVMEALKLSPTLQNQVIDMNDAEGQLFAGIADYLEKEFKKEND